MTLQGRSHLGPYEITAKLGEGGMGEVYRATDSRLRREVAIKVLPAAFTADRERLARFEREAQLLAQLHHPNIASIFGLEELDGTRALVMELVEGQTLAERLAGGALPIEECLAIARQIAEALEEAHEKGIVHRDLKPQNVKVSPENRVKVLDFGLAKAMDPASSASGSPLSPDLAASPTVTLGATMQGVILGTAGYMSPEQAKGIAVDKRADIWAFGVVLYEMLTGERLFEGDSVPETLAGVLKTEIDLDKLPAATPPRVRSVIERCLVRDRRQRLHDIGDARLELEDASAPAQKSAASAVVRPSRTRAAALFALGALAGATLVGLAWRAIAGGGEGAPQPAARLSIVVPAGQQLVNSDLSPDGSTLVTVLRPKGDRAARNRLYVRPLDRFDFTPVPESDGALGYTFSPDGRWLYFVAPLAAGATQQRLARVPIDGSSAPVTVRRWSESWVGWTVLPDGDILVASEGGQKYLRLPAGGEDPPPAQPIRGDLAGSSALFMDERLPDGSPLLRIQGYGPRGYQDAVGAFDLGSGTARRLVDDAVRGVVLPSGQLLFGRGDALLVAPLDAERGKVTGAPRSVFTGVRTIDPGEPYPMFALARNGTLAYVPGSRVGGGRRLMVVDRDGGITPWAAERMPFLLDPSLAGGRLAVTAMELNGLLFEIWVAELEAARLRRLVSTPGLDNSDPVLSGDGTRLAFRRYGRSAQDGLFVRSVDGGEERRLAAITPTTNFAPRAWSPDGSRLLAARVNEGKSDIVSFAADATGGAAPRPLLASPFDEIDAVFAPDGRSLAYVSNESGRNEVYVAPLRPDGALGPGVNVSAGQGLAPRWRPDGRTLLFWDGREHILSVPVTTSPRVTAGSPEVLLDLPKLGLTGGYGVLPDGRLLVVARGEEEADITRIDVVLGFAAELEKAAQSGASR